MILGPRLSGEMGIREIFDQGPPEYPTEGFSPRSDIQGARGRIFRVFAEPEGGYVAYPHFPTKPTQEDIVIGTNLAVEQPA